MEKQERAFWRLAAAIFVLFVGILYFPVLLGKIPFPGDLLLWFPVWADRIKPNVRSYADIGDLITFFYPARALAAQSVKHGILPLWNPLLLSGAPFLANSQSSLFYPLNVLYYVLPLSTAWATSMMLRMFLAALFMAMFVRSMGGSRTGAVFSGILFGSCGFMTAWQGQSMSDSAIWLPFACNAIQRLHKNVSGMSIAIAAIGFAMPVLAGHPETAAHITLTGTALALMLWFFPTEPEKSRFDPRFIGGFALAGALALGLASVQMIPTVEWLKQIGEAFNTWPALQPRQALGWVSRDILRSPNSAGIAIPEAAAYMAMIGLLAMPLAVFHRPRLYVVFLFVAAACAIAVAYGVAPIYDFVSHIPVLGSLKNFRMLVGSFAVAALSGLGISVLEEQIPFTQWKRLAAVALVGATFAATFLMIYQLQLMTTFKAEVTHRPSFSRTLLIISLIMIGWRLYGGLRGRVFPIAVCAIAMFDLGTFGFAYMDFADRDAIFPASPAFDFLRQNDKSQYRIIEVGVPYPSNTPVMYGLDSADGYESSVISHQHAFLEDLIDRDSNGINFTPDGILLKKDRRLDLLNVKYIVVPAFVPVFKQFSQSDRLVQVFNNRHIAIFNNRSALPRAWIIAASGLEAFSAFDAELDRLKNAAFDPLKSATISETSLGLPSAGNVAAGAFTGSATITESSVVGLTINTQASSPALLIVSQTFYPGWKAVSDGNKTGILRVDATLTGVAVPAGTHEIRLTFQPLSFRIGLGLTVLSTVILLLMAAATLRAQRKRAKRDAMPANEISKIAIR
jgi:hypothetical protein